MTHPIDDVLRSAAQTQPTFAGFLHKLTKRVRIQTTQLIYSDEDDPKLMDTVGTLIDKLVTVDLKMWHNQETLYAIRRMSSDDFQESYGENLEELHAIIKRCCDLNVQRSRLMDAIDEKLKNAIAQGEVPVMAQHKTY